MGKLKKFGKGLKGALLSSTLIEVLDFGLKFSEVLPPEQEDLKNLIRLIAHGIVVYRASVQNPDGSPVAEPYVKPPKKKKK